ncbi:tigger transposable element-derived protein 4-like [Rhipicephalus sanguineus]|uniref:tigger transposable element-derived protein 4-like n=1 Tax=Rhipicephalus sanguineus TaxID=34632 RepID=UPI0020C5A56A|nr:tigger transposable element-derived protein 4-like [Rhipicephalus sanguineus]
MLPDRSLAFSGDPCTGGKLSKERITVMVGANATGTEKLPLLVIGKARNPRCFRAMKTLPVEYESNSKAWITQALFEQYVRRLDRKFARQHRKVILFVDNCGAHGSVPNLEAIRLEFLPPNTSSVLQPMDQGVIRNIKAHYRARLLNCTVLCLDSGKAYKVDILAAIHMLAEAWKAVKPETIANCFRHAGFGAAEEAEADDLDVRDLRSGGVDVPAMVTFRDFTGADDDVVSCAEPTEDEILRQVVPQPESGSDDDDDKDDRPQPSAAQIIDAVTLLMGVYGEDVTLAQIQANAIACRRNMRQGSIKEFFKPARMQ